MPLPSAGSPKTTYSPDSNSKSNSATAQDRVNIVEPIPSMVGIRGRGRRSTRVLWIIAIEALGVAPSPVEVDVELDVVLELVIVTWRGVLRMISSECRLPDVCQMEPLVRSVAVEG